MEDIELHDAARVKTIIGKGGRCNASQSDVTRILFHHLESIVIMYLIPIIMHTNMEADMHHFHYFACFWYTQLRLMQESSIGNAIINSVIGLVGSIEDCPLPGKKTLRIHGA